MAKRARPIPQLLAKKLKKIRLDADYRQYQMRGVILPDLEADEFVNAPIADYESGRRAPSYPEILRYANFGRVSLEYLLDDNIQLTEMSAHQTVKLNDLKKDGLGAIFQPRQRKEILARLEALENEVQQLKLLLLDSIGD